MDNKNLFGGDNSPNKLRCGTCQCVISQNGYKPRITFFYIDDVKTSVFNQSNISFTSPCCGMQKYLLWGIN